jgi:hypothetical protein
LPSGVAATPNGEAPTEIVALTELVAVSMTDTVFDAWFAT